MFEKFEELNPQKTVKRTKKFYDRKFICKSIKKIMQQTLK